jgi:putative ABC transport system permease protein
MGSMSSLLRNLRYALRMLARTPGITVAIILTLTLAIGANTAIFTATNAILLRPFPYRDPGKLVTIVTQDKDKEFGTSLVRYETVRDQNRSFEAVAVWTNDNLNLTGNGEPVQFPVARVSPGFFDLLGVRPQLGRAFTADEGRPDGKPVVMLSDSLWRARYHADPNIVGQAITLDSTAQTVVGVLPANVQFPFVGPADVWSPRYFELSLMPAERLRQGVGYLSILARLRPATTLAEADAELAVLNQHYREQNPTAPDSNPEMTMTAVSLRDLVVGNTRGKIAMLSAAVALVLLIACANVAALLLARAIARQKEIAMRTALGARRGVIFRQLLTESMLLALMAGLFGATLGWAAMRALEKWGAGQLPAGIPLELDLRVLAFTLLVSALAGFLFGTIPALHSARVDLNTTLRNEAGSASQGHQRATITSLLVVGQVALSLLLLIFAGLFLRSFERLLNVDPGFEARNVLTMNLSLSTTRYAKPGQQIAFFDDVLRRVSAVPGVRSAAISATQPLSWIRITPVLAEGQPEVPLGERPFVDIEAISPQWFETMRVPLLGGRAFTAADQPQSPPVIIVNETFAREYWPDQNPVGKHVVIGRRPQPAEVVGVAADIKNRGLEQTTQPQLYLPFPQLPWNDMYLLLRTGVPPHSVLSAVRAQIAQVDSDQPVIKVQTVDDILDNARTQPRLLLMLIGAFAATALVLAVIGIYGMLSYAVAQRRQEFGIRLALGAERGDLLRLVLRRGMALASTGIILGIAAALLLTRFVASLLYGISARDLITFVAAPLVFVFVALLASYLPARRATRANPLEAIK